MTTQIKIFLKRVHRTNKKLMEIVIILNKMKKELRLSIKSLYLWKFQKTNNHQLEEESVWRKPSKEKLENFQVGRKEKQSRCKINKMTCQIMKTINS